MKFIIMSMIVSLLLASSATFARQNNGGLSHTPKKCTYASKDYDEGSVVTMGGVNKTCKKGEWIIPIGISRPSTDHRARPPVRLPARMFAQ